VEKSYKTVENLLELHNNPVFAMLFSYVNKTMGENEQNSAKMP
jgi:hypothetical protein